MSWMTIFSFQLDHTSSWFVKNVKYELFWFCHKIAVDLMRISRVVVWQTRVLSENEEVWF